MTYNSSFHLPVAFKVLSGMPIYPEFHDLLIVFFSEAKKSRGFFFFQDIIHDFL